MAAAVTAGVGPLTTQVASNTAALAPATSSKAGLVKPGTGLAVSADGTLSTNGTGGTAYTLPAASTSALGGIKVGANLTVAADGTISGPAPSGGSYTLPAATAAALGGVKAGTGLAVTTDGTLSTTGAGGTATPLSNATPQPAFGPGGPGIGTAAARDDHYHPAAPGVTIRPITVAGPVTVLASDAGGFIVINKTTGEATTVNLLDGVRVTVKDGKGDAATNPITLTPPANGAIDGQPTKVMDSAYDALGVLSYGGGKFGLY